VLILCLNKKNVETKLIAGQYLKKPSSGTENFTSETFCISRYCNVVVYPHSDARHAAGINLANAHYIAALSYFVAFAS
jgi:hypothetical protein